jgi:catechol 2,3-dioxygenase-like lactoylglutathione lyase family enzyme
MRFTTIAAYAAGLCLFSASAQQALRKDPAVYTGGERTPRVGVRPPGIRLGLRTPREVALAPLSEAEVALLAGPGPRLVNGVQRKLAPHDIAAGSWDAADSGRVWRMSVRSPGSRGIRVEFDSFDVGAGEVWVHDGANTAGPYTGRGPHDDGHFFAETVDSAAAIVEYVPAAGVPVELEPPFQIRSIIHQQRTRSRLDTSDKDPADYCEIDANCYSDWKGAVSSVGQISFVDDGVSYFCSGSLVATRDNSFKPYFLTAGHCIHSETTARTVEAYWTYQTASCGAPAPTSRSNSTKSTGGAHLIASGGPDQGDFSLILLANVPSGVTFSGWDTNDPPVTASLTGIHHPSASWKRISFGDRGDDQAVNVEGSVAPADLYLQVLYSMGRVEHGSSGSPLFSSPGVIVGSLSYGELLSDGSVCPLNPQGAGYSRFSNTYAHVKDYLENLPASMVLPDRTSVSFAVANRTATAAQSVRLTTQAGTAVPFRLRPDAEWIQVSMVNGTTPASATISIDPAKLPQAGQYNGTVTILTGSADPVYVNVAATVKVDQSSVGASITPAAVVQNGGTWSFQIRLAETAGVATHLTALKFNGTDYSGNIGSWFGTTKIPAFGAIVAPLTGTGLFPAGEQYFEFWGADDVTGLPWYRVAVVTFR